MTRFTINPVVENTSRESVDFGRAVPAHEFGGKDLAGLVERPVVEIDDAEILSKKIGPLGVRRQLEGESALGRVLGSERTD